MYKIYYRTQNALILTIFILQSNTKSDASYDVEWCESKYNINKCLRHLVLKPQTNKIRF
jgi:hypothetical protein